MGKTNH